MAIVAPTYQQMQEDEEKKKQLAAQGQQGGRETLASTSGYVGAGTGGSSSTSNSNPNASNTAAGTSSGAWTNLNKYLEANAGAGASMAGKIGEGISSTAKQAQTKAGVWEGDATKGVQGQAIGETGGIVDGLKGDVTKVDKTGFNKAYNYEFGGPKVADAWKQEDWADVQNKASKVDRDIADTQTEGGRQRLTKENFGDAKYTRGENVFDSFLTQADGGENFAGAREANKNFRDPITGAKTRVQGVIDETVKTGEAGRQAVRDAWETRFKDMNTGFDTAYKTAQTEDAADDAEFNRLLEGARKGDPAALQALGLNLNSANIAVRPDFGGLETVFKNSKNRSFGDVVSDQDRATYEALQELRGLGTDRDFTKSGGRKGVFDADDPRLQALNELGSLEADLTGRLTRKQGERDKQYQDYLKARENLPVIQKQLDGIQAKKDAAFAKYYKNNPERYRVELDKLMKEEGRITAQIDELESLNNANNNAVNSEIIGVNQGRKMNMGDVALDPERDKWRELKKFLNIGGDTLEDLGDEGTAFTAVTRATPQYVPSGKGDSPEKKQKLNHDQLWRKGMGW